jgi:tRNA 5-methylaminomethyl-2-thiouridine biosynthesis bifunctional protein
MKPSNTFTDDGPYSTLFEDIYFSTKNGYEESKYVFLDHNNLDLRWQRISPNTSCSFIIFETGFGTGLNFFIASALWNKLTQLSEHLYFFSVEKHPLSLNDISKSISPWPSLSPYVDALSKQDLCLHDGLHCFDIAPNIHLHLYIGDIADAFANWLPNSSKPSSSHKVDAWFLDGFSPKKNPKMWSPELYSFMSQHSHDHTSFATFTSAGHVRRGLENEGFLVKKAKGFGHKREMIHGTYNSPEQHNNKGPWHHYFPKTFPNKTALIIGAGMAGCTTAYALAQTGWHVTLIEKNTLASGTSGNKQSILYSRLTHPSNYLTSFNLASWHFATRHFKRLLAEHNDPLMGDLCGTLQLAYNQKEYKRLKNLYNYFSKINPEFCQFLTAIECSKVAGVPVKHDGLFFPNGGWINPETYCKALINHPNISLLTHTEIDRLHYDKGWHAYSSNTCVSADIAIICNSEQANTLSASPSYPLKIIRGQVSHFSPTELSKNIKTVLCHRGYIAPHYRDTHDVGATFTLHQHHLNVTPEEHRENLEQLHHSLPSLAKSFNASLSNASGRTGLRCNTVDYMPIVGEVPNEKLFTQAFSKLRKNAKQDIMSTDCSQPGLFINIAHGSRGLSSTPILAQHLCSLVNNSPSPLTYSMQKTLHPSRFLIQQLKRNKK